MFMTDEWSLNLPSGPSYKRGPPKGYIHAIESRWHQVEALLGAILQCPDARVQSIVSDASNYPHATFVILTAVWLFS